MKKLIIMAIVLSLLESCANLKKYEWTNADKAMFAAATVANGYDCYTTMRVLNNDGHIKSPWQVLYLGDDTPSDGLLIGSKIAQLGLAYVVLDYVPSDWRKVMLFMMTGTWVFYGATNEY